jgi:S-adenosylmethionine:tRNA ribosyltransferase-isomerase
MKTDLFDFDLPRDLIADRPVSPRDAAKMLVVSDDLADRVVNELPDLLRAGDVMVFNDTRVIPARLSGIRRAERGQSNAEITLLKPTDDGAWLALAKPAKRLRAGDVIEFGEDFSAAVEWREGPEVIVRFDRGGADLLNILDEQGQMPLPPYMGRAGDARDLEDYQTVYADEAGAVAAPTAGLHFTDELLAAIDAVGVTRVHVTLHVGAGTFLPMVAEDTRDHVMHAEWGSVDATAADKINTARQNGGRIICVGTTSLRLMESAADEAGHVHPFEAETDIFITPGYKFKAVDALMTNFHLPKSTLFMLVSALAGLDRMQAAYAHARNAGYRFYSYGDCSFLEATSILEAAKR